MHEMLIFIFIIRNADIVHEGYIFPVVLKIYADEYVDFIFPFVCSSIHIFVCSSVIPSVTLVEAASKFCVKVTQVVNISVTTNQKAFIFGPEYA